MAAEKFSVEFPVSKVSADTGTVSNHSEVKLSMKLFEQNPFLV
jgi:hypothetical protein